MCINPRGKSGVLVEVSLKKAGEVFFDTDLIVILLICAVNNIYLRSLLVVSASHF